MDRSPAEDEWPVEEVVVIQPLHSHVELIMVNRTNKGRLVLDVWGGYDGFVTYTGEDAEIWEKFHWHLREG